MKQLPILLAQQLSGLGIQFAFGIPGGPFIPFMEAFKNQGIRVITTANEQSAGIMADVYSRLTGLPGVCFATFGPGATNLSTGVGTAYLDRSALIALSSELPEKDQGRRIQMNVDHQQIFTPVTKWTSRVDENNWFDEFQTGLTKAYQEYPGPFHIGIPTDISEGVDVDDHLSMPEAFDARPDDSTFDRLQARIRQAKKPLLVLGLSAKRAHIDTTLQQAIEKHRIPVVITPMAKGILPHQHPNYVGVLFHAATNHVAETYRQADLIIALGYDTIEFSYESWAPDVDILHIDTEPVDIRGHHGKVTDVISSMNHVASWLLDLEPVTTAWDFDEIARHKAAMFTALTPKTEHMNPSDVLQTVHEVIADNAIVTLDVGAHTHLIGQLWEVKPGSELIMTNGWSSMGFAIPSAMAAKLAYPERQVVTFVGDGCFLMNCGELMVAKREGIPFVTVVLVDHDYTLIKVKQDWKHVPHYATQVNETEYFEADRFLGVPVLTVRSVTELKGAMEQGLQQMEPVIIEAFVDGTIYHDLIIREYK